MTAFGGSHICFHRHDVYHVKAVKEELCLGEPRLRCNILIFPRRGVGLKLHTVNE